MSDSNFSKYVLVFIGASYVLACAGEALLVKNGVELAFESIKSVMPHMAMFILGFYFSKR